MDFEGKVLEILPAVTGQSARGMWERQTVVFEQANKQYGKEIAVTFMNKGQEVASLRVGESYTAEEPQASYSAGAGVVDDMPF